jgi:EAL domain-containing protein (putative c-di-GMP-specific phosphodiesterase class I)
MGNLLDFIEVLSGMKKNRMTAYVDDFGTG